jgi:hypothetical protein
MYDYEEGIKMASRMMPVTLWGLDCAQWHSKFENSTPTIDHKTYVASSTDGKMESQLNSSEETVMTQSAIT